MAFFAACGAALGLQDALLDRFAQGCAGEQSIGIENAAFIARRKKLVLKPFQYFARATRIRIR